MDDAVKEWLRQIGRTGGQARSRAKTAAARENARKRWAKAKRKRRTAGAPMLSGQQVSLSRPSMRREAKEQRARLIARARRLDGMATARRARTVKEGETTK